MANAPASATSTESSSTGSSSTGATHPATTTTTITTTTTSTVNDAEGSSTTTTVTTTTNNGAPARGGGAGGGTGWEHMLAMLAAIDTRLGSIEQQAKKTQPTRPMTAKQETAPTGIDTSSAEAASVHVTADQAAPATTLKAKQAGATLKTTATSSSEAGATVSVKDMTGLQAQLCELQRQISALAKHASSSSLAAPTTSTTSSNSEPAQAEDAADSSQPAVKAPTFSFNFNRPTSDAQDKSQAAKATAALPFAFKAGGSTAVPSSPPAPVKSHQTAQAPAAATASPSTVPPPSQSAPVAKQQQTIQQQEATQQQELTQQKELPLPSEQLMMCDPAMLGTFDGNPEKLPRFLRRILIVVRADPSPEWEKTVMRSAVMGLTDLAKRWYTTLPKAHQARTQTYSTFATMLGAAFPIDRAHLAEAAHELSLTPGRGTTTTSTTTTMTATAEHLYEKLLLSFQADRTTSRRDLFSGKGGYVVYDPSHASDTALSRSEAVAAVMAALERTRFPERRSGAF